MIHPLSNLVEVVERGYRLGKESYRVLRKVANELEIANDLKVMELNTKQSEEYVSTKRDELDAALNGNLSEE